MLHRRLARRWLAVVALLLTPLPSGAGELDPTEGYNLVIGLMSNGRRERRKAAERLVAAGDRSLVPGIVDALFFIPKLSRKEALEVLAALTGEVGRREYRDWVEWIGAHGELSPKPGYLALKQALFKRIDPGYETILYPGASHTVRPEEIVWGGVRIDGLPPVERPPVVVAAAARYLGDGDRVFGVSVAGEHRAYPVKVLSWHEMLNDVVGGEAVTLSYCTLCGSGVLYAGRVGDRTFTFGTSGLLLRSNKLMWDRETRSLWSNLTGEPVMGALAGSGLRLEMLPMTLTTWKAWRTLHPDSTAMALEGDWVKAGERLGFRYQEGAADDARRGVSFPVWRKSEALGDKDEIYALRVRGAAKAYPLDALITAGVVLDQVGGVDLVLVADPESGAVRAFERRGGTFTRAEDGALVDGEGRRWRITEEALTPEGLAGEPLPRVPGHVAFWFGWFGFYPNTAVWRPE